MKKSCADCAPEARTQNRNCIQEIFIKISIFKEEYQKIFKKLTFFFFSKPVPFKFRKNSFASDVLLD